MAEHSDGTTANYYLLPPGAGQLQDLISFKNMNGQMAEIFRANYRYGQCGHSNKLREINKILFYALAEKERLLKYDPEACGGVVADDSKVQTCFSAGDIADTAATSFREGAESTSSGPITEGAIAKMVDRFLGWQLPKGFCPDGGISFTPGNSWWPVGTNLLTAEQAREMVTHMLGIGPNETK